jgi:hypothetical protein
MSDMAKLGIIAKWVSAHGEDIEQILTARPLTTPNHYYELIINENVINIDTLSSHNSLNTLIELVVKDMLLRRMQSHGKLIDKVLFLTIENMENHNKVVAKTDINLYAYNMSILDLSNDSEVCKALLERIVKFMELGCTLYVKPLH